MLNFVMNETGCAEKWKIEGAKIVGEHQQTLKQSKVQAQIIQPKDVSSEKDGTNQIADAELPNQNQDEEPEEVFEIEEEEPIPAEDPDIPNQSHG